MAKKSSNSSSIFSFSFGYYGFFLFCFHCDGTVYIYWIFLDQEETSGYYFFFSYLITQIFFIFSSIYMGYFLQFFECFIQLARYNHPTGRLGQPPLWTEGETLEGDRRLTQNKIRIQRDLEPIQLWRDSLEHNGLSNLEGTQVIFFLQHLTYWYLFFNFIFDIFILFLDLQNSISDFWTF